MRWAECTIAPHDVHGEAREVAVSNLADYEGGESQRRGAGRRIRGESYRAPGARSRDPMLETLQRNPRGRRNWNTLTVVAVPGGSIRFFITIHTKF